MIHKSLCLILIQMLIAFPAEASDSVFAPAGANTRFVASQVRQTFVSPSSKVPAKSKTLDPSMLLSVTGASSKNQMGVAVTNAVKPAVANAKSNYGIANNGLIYPNVGANFQANTLAAEIAAGRQVPLIFPNTGAMPMPMSSGGVGNAINPMSSLGRMMGGNGPYANANNNAFQNYLNNAAGPQRNDPYVSGDLSSLSGGNQCSVPVQKENADDKHLLASAPANVPNLTNYNCDNRMQRDRMTCMVCNEIYEVDGNENFNGYLAVAQTVMTRAMSSDYPATVCGVVYQHAQFSWTDERKNHHLPNMNSRRMQMAIAAAKKALATGPNGFDNYYSPKGMLAITGGRTSQASWAGYGNCARTHCALGEGTQIFCANRPLQDRSVERYLEAENLLSSSRTLASASTTTR